MLRTMSNTVLIGIQGQVTTKWIVLSGWHSILSEIWWLSWLPESLKMIRSKVKALFSGQIFHCSRATPKWIVTKIELGPDFKAVLITCKFDEDPIKNYGQHFPHYKTMGAIDGHGNRNFDPICAKTLRTISILHIQFDKDSPTCLRDIQVWKCGRTNGRRMDSGPLVYQYYKLTLLKGNS